MTRSAIQQQQGMPCARRRQGGFTLVELAVVVFIVTIILGSIIVPLSAQVEQRQVAEAQRQMEEIKEAIVGFALRQGFLPCPDKTTAGGLGLPNDGLEDRPGGCLTEEGNVPWATLGVGAVDPWGNRFRYRVTADYANATAPFALDTPGNIRLCRVVNVATTSCPVGEELSVSAISHNSPVAVIVSHGPNRWAGVNEQTTTLTLPPGCATVASCTGAMSDNERANGDIGFTTSGLRTFVSRPASARGSSANEFDDLVVWLSPHVLRNRMVAAGKLP